MIGFDRGIVQLQDQRCISAIPKDIPETWGISHLGRDVTDAVLFSMLLTLLFHTCTLESLEDPADLAPTADIVGLNPSTDPPFAS